MIFKLLSGVDTLQGGWFSRYIFSLSMFEIVQHFRAKNKGVYEKCVTVPLGKEFLGSS